MKRKSQSHNLFKRMLYYIRFEYILPENTFVSIRISNLSETVRQAAYTLGPISAIPDF